MAGLCFTEHGELREDGGENATAFTSDTYWAWIIYGTSLQMECSVVYL